jgi:acyl-CoA thioesterase
VTAFARATAVAPAGAGAYAATFDPEWNAPGGANGGYVAAIVLRAMLAELADAERAPRTLTLHYVRAPHAGPAEVRVTVERSGRNLSTLSARVVQGERLAVLALAAFAPDYPSALDYAEPPPGAPDPDAIAPLPHRDGAPPIGQWFEVRPAFGPRPFSGAGEAVTGGWLRLAEPEPLDAPALALYTDAWLPAPFPRLTGPSPAPTIELTIHVRARAALGTEEPLLARMTSRTSREGFFEEDGELWARDGTLLAQSRQLALLLPWPGGDGG